MLDGFEFGMTDVVTLLDIQLWRNNRLFTRLISNKFTAVAICPWIKILHKCGHLCALHSFQIWFELVEFLSFLFCHNDLVVRDSLFTTFSYTVANSFEPHLLLAHWLLKLLYFFVQSSLIMIQAFRLILFLRSMCTHFGLSLVNKFLKLSIVYL